VEIPFAEVYDKVFNMEYVTYSELFDSDKFENSRILKIMRESEVDSCFFKNGYIEYLGSVECKSVKYNLYTKSFKKEE
jgi:hypothetical protein